jgi:hypothetical protein
MTVAEVVRRAVPVFTANPTADVFVIRHELERVGVPPPLAADVVDFLPLAVARALLDGMGIRFSDEYVRQSSQGRVIGQRKLIDEPVYREGLAVAGEVSGIGDEVFLALVGRSPEYRAVRAAMDAGTRPEDLEYGPPVMIALANDPRLFPGHGGQSDKRWWQFWK